MSRELLRFLLAASTLALLLALATVYLPIQGRGAHQYPDPEAFLEELGALPALPPIQGPSGWRRRGGDPARPDPRLPSQFEGLAALRGGHRVRWWER